MALCAYALTFLHARALWLSRVWYVALRHELMERTASDRHIWVSSWYASYEVRTLRAEMAWNDLHTSEGFSSLRGNCTFFLCMWAQEANLHFFMFMSVSLASLRMICEVLINLPTNQIVVTFKGASAAGVYHICSRSAVVVCILISERPNLGSSLCFVTILIY